MKRFVPIVGLLLIPFVFYWKLFALDLTERKIFRGDFLNQHYVWKSYFLNRIKSGELPLWNPHVLGGVPVHANPQVGMFYPPNYLLLPFHTEGSLSYVALEAFQLLHQALAGFGMWLLLRWLGLGVGASLAGALVAMFTGFFTTPGHHGLVLSASWIPLAFYLTGRAVTKTGTRSVGLAALGLSAMLLAGHPQPAFYGVLAVIVWAWFVGGLRATLRRFVPALGLALAVASIQLLPTYLLAWDSYRAGSGYDFATSFEFSPFWLWAALVPRGQLLPPGQLASAPLHIYVGVGSLFLAAVGIAWSRSRVRWFFASLAVVALLLSMGSHSFLFDVTYWSIPGFGWFRIPFRLLGLFALAMAVLTALGLDSLVEENRRSRRRLGSVLKAGAVLMVILAAWSAYIYTELLRGSESTPLQQAERLQTGVNWTLILVALNMCFLLAFKWRRGWRWPAWALVAVLAIDIGSFVKDRGLRPYRTLVRTGERRVTRLLRSQGLRGRYVTDSNLENYAMLHGTEFAGGHFSMVDERYAGLLNRSRKSANVLALLNVKFVDRMAPPSTITWCGRRFRSPLPLIDIWPEISPLTLELRPARKVGQLRVFWSSLAPGGRATILVNKMSHAFPSEGPLKLRFSPPTVLKQLTVRVEESGSGVRIEDIELDGVSLGLVADFLDLGNLYLNLHCLPRAYFLPSCTSSVGQGEERGEKNLDELSCWTPAKDLLLEPREAPPQYGESSAMGIVEILRYEPETVDLEAELPGPGYVVLGDTYRRGWRAQVDGNEVPILRAHLAQRAVAVTAGRHTIRFSYRPRSLYLGMALSLLGLMVVLACVIGVDKMIGRLRPR